MLSVVAPTKRPVDEMAWHLNCHSRQPDFDSLEFQGVEALHKDVQLGTWSQSYETFYGSNLRNFVIR
jgi:hypothetical protein